MSLSDIISQPAVISSRWYYQSRYSTYNHREPPRHGDLFEAEDIIPLRSVLFGNNVAKFRFFYRQLMKSHPNILNTSEITDARLWRLAYQFHPNQPTDIAAWVILAGYLSGEVPLGIALQFIEE